MVALAITPGAITNVTVYGQSTGVIGLPTVSGGTPAYSYLWSSSVGATTISTATTLTGKTGLSAGTYTLVVTDSTSATATYAFVITQSPLLVLSPGHASPPTVFAQFSGEVDESLVTGGVPPYTYAWTSDDSAASVTGGTSTSGAIPVTNGFTPATYVLTVTDSVGGTVSSSVVINDAPGKIYASACGHSNLKPER